MSSLLIGPSVCAPDTLSEVPYTLVSGASVKFGVQAAIDERPIQRSPYAAALPFAAPPRTPEVDRVEISITTGAGTTTQTVTAKSERQPSLTDGGNDTALVFDWNNSGFDLTAEADGAFIVSPVVYDDQGNARTLTPRTFYNNSAGSITRGRVFVRNGGNDANDGSSVGQAVQTIARAQQLVTGHCFIDLGAGEDYNETDMSATRGPAVDGWVTFECTSGTATLSGIHGTNSGLGNHKRWALGQGIDLTGRLAIHQGDTQEGLWWLDGCRAYTSGGNGNPTPVSGQVAHGLNTARMSGWFATDFESFDVVEFNTAPTLARGSEQHDITGDMFAKASRAHDSLMYACSFYTIFQAGGTHSDWNQSADGNSGTAWPMADQMRHCYYQGMRINDTEASFWQMSNDESPVMNIVFENCLMHNRGLLTNIGEGGVTNVNILTSGWNVLFIHCTFIEQSMRLEPVGKHRWVYKNCILADIDSTSTASPLTAITLCDIDVSDTVYNVAGSTFPLGSIPGTNQIDGVPVFELVTTASTNTGLNHTQQDYRLATGSVGKNVAASYQGKPASVVDCGVWDNVATNNFALSVA